MTNRDSGFKTYGTVKLYTQMLARYLGTKLKVLSALTRSLGVHDSSKIILKLDHQSLYITASVSCSPIVSLCISDLVLYRSFFQSAACRLASCCSNSVLEIMSLQRAHMHFFSGNLISPDCGPVSSSIVM